VTRAVIFELSQSLDLAKRETNLTLEQIFNTDGVFLSLSSMGVVEASVLDGRPLNQSPTTERIRLAYVDLVRRETGGKTTDTVP
jgi:branched-subunit amino acid aminotransferase/4-amino-4-deoxychorismate lyase